MGRSKLQLQLRKLGVRKADFEGRRLKHAVEEGRKRERIRAFVRSSGL